MRLLIATLCAAAVFWCSSCSPTPSTDKSRANNNFTVPTLDAQNGSNALQYVARLLELGERDAGTSGAETAAKWIMEELRAAGLPEVQIESFVDTTPDGPATFHNVLAMMHGNSPTRILLLSHFDTKSKISTAERKFQGANDSGSSTGLLLELAAVLAKQLKRPPLYTIQWAFLDGEECRYNYGPHDGLHGSRYLANKMKSEGVNFKAVILLDMIGDRNLQVTMPRNSTPALKAFVFKAASALGVRNKFSLYDGNILDDHQPFFEAGYPAVNLIDFTFGSSLGANDYWHTLEDTLDKLDYESLRIVGNVVLKVIELCQNE